MPVIKKEIILKGTTKEIFKRMSEYSFIQEMQMYVQKLFLKNQESSDMV